MCALSLKEEKEKDVAVEQETRLIGFNASVGCAGRRSFFLSMASQRVPIEPLVSGGGGGEKLFI
jgi:predicted metal-binding protein